MTPLYDILTAQPSVDAGQVNPKKFKLSMSVGDNNHYRTSEVTPRHFLQTADRCNFDAGIIRGAMEHLLDTAKAAAEKTVVDLGNQIPCGLADSVLAGISARLNAIALWKKAGDV
jgi:serine/threonine-protein kinase HipA